MCRTDKQTVWQTDRGTDFGIARATPHCIARPKWRICFISCIECSVILVSHTRFKISKYHLHHMIDDREMFLRSNFTASNLGVYPNDCVKPSPSLRQQKVAYLSIMSRTRCKIERKLPLFTNRKSHTGFPFVPKLVTLNDLERNNGHCFALFHRIRHILWQTTWNRLRM